MAGKRTDPEYQLVARHALTAAEVKRWIAVQRGLIALQRAHPELRDKYRALDRDEGEAQSIEEQARALERVPEVRRELTKAGVTPRSYLVTTWAMFTSGMYAELLKQGLMKEADVPAEIPRENFAVLQAFAKEFDEVRRETQRLEREQRARVDEEDSDQGDEDGEPAEDEPSDSTGARRGAR
ncbi:MAG TPA: hypothetical protein VNA89_04020 [Gemmatimonadaceae bacterium]|nr:hypothetical protein [Gemmatimonadaceae bacterium]